MGPMHRSTFAKRPITSHRILNGTKPGELPINASSRFDFVINLRTARAFGFSLTADFISAADEVIE
jgi:putative ABC transport system substrate-binding protein